MKITILNHLKVNTIPSGSGISKSGDTYYVVGDDSPYLYALNKSFEIISKTPLLADAREVVGRIPKPEKPDFESIEMISENELVIFGSGSLSPQRDVFIRALLDEEVTVEQYSITEFYDQLRTLPIFEDSELNIEATAFRDNQLYLFNRKKNLILKFYYPDFLAYIKGELSFPTPEIKEFFLPKINGLEAGFSGATTLTKQAKIVFTASLEDTDNAYDDGEILGSFIGIIDISENQISETYTFCAIPNTDEKLKVESVTIQEEIAPGNTRVVLITDDDLGNSIILESVILW